MPAPLNLQPAGYIPAEFKQRLQETAEEAHQMARSAIPVFVRRIWGAIKQTKRPTENPAFLINYAQTFPGGRKLDDRTAKSIDAILPYLAVNHDISTGIVIGTMLERDLGIQCGLCTYKGKVVVSQKEYDYRKANQQPINNLVTYKDIPHEDTRNIGHGRVSHALTILRKMGLIRYLDKQLRATNMHFIGRHQWLTDKFYTALGIPLDDEIKRERMERMRLKPFLKYFNLSRAPRNLDEAKTWVLQWSRELRYNLYNKMRKEAVAYNARKAADAAHKTDAQLRSEITREVVKELTKKDLLDGNLNKDNITTLVEQRLNTIRNHAKIGTLKTTLKPPITT